jgi:predicted transcriptional regulator
MARSTRDVTDAELAVLQSLWDRGMATIRQLTDAIYPDGGAAHYGTVQKLLDRLEAKGHVERRRQDNVNVYAPTTDRDDLIGRRLQSVAEQLCGGSLTPLLTHLVKHQRLTAKEREELRNLIETAAKSSSRNSRG